MHPQIQSNSSSLSGLKTQFPWDSSPTESCPSSKTQGAPTCQRHKASQSARPPRRRPESIGFPKLR